jgi:Zn-dependent oligopeptidase
MLENWIWEANITKRISKHYKTGVPLPDALIEKQLKRKTSHQGLELMH